MDMKDKMENHSKNVDESQVSQGFEVAEGT